MSANISLRLDKFRRHERQRKVGERARGGWRGCSAVSATNEAIMRAKHRARLYQRICDAPCIAESPSQQ